nr:MAG TPA: tail protein [Caudoviricetes sp.]
MIDTLDIYRIVDGSPVLITSIASDEAVLGNVIMGKNEIAVSLVTEVILDIKEGDYILLEGIKYRLNREPEFVDKTIIHDTTFVFEAPEYTLIDKILTNRITGSTKVTLLGKLHDWIELLVWNVNKAADNPLGVDSGWQIGSIPDTDYITLTFDGIDCRSLLSELSSAYEYEYYVENKTINYVSRIENERDLSFTQGRGNGLYEIRQSNVDSGDITTRIYPVGGTENIIPGEGDAEGRLILPEKYIENFSETNRVVEKKVVFEKVHPTFTGKVETLSGENNREFVCSTIDFDITELAFNDEARVNFLTGDLMGKSFEFKWNNGEKKITLIYQEDTLATIDPETQKRPTIPSELKCLHGGEDFNFTGIRLGEAYKSAAVTKLREKATDWLNFHSQKRVKFTLLVDYRYMRGKGDLKPGDLITVNIPERNISKLIRITSTEKNLKTGEITCVVSNYLSEKWEDKIEGQIGTIQATINGGGGNTGITVLEKYDDRTPSDKNVFSSLRTISEIADNNEDLKKVFLSKVKKDTASGHLTLYNGGTVENGLIVRLPKQDTPAALMSCLLEEDIDTLIEEDEDVIMEIAPAEISDLSFGGLSNVNSSVDSAPIGSLPVKSENEWSYVAPTLYAGVVDADNMLVPVFDRRTQTMVFIPISAIRGGVTPPPTGFPYTFSFALR